MQHWLQAYSELIMLLMQGCLQHISFSPCYVIVYSASSRFTCSAHASCLASLTEKANSVVHISSRRQGCGHRYMHHTETLP